MISEKTGEVGGGEEEVRSVGKGLFVSGWESVALHLLHGQTAGSLLMMLYKGAAKKHQKEGMLVFYLPPLEVVGAFNDPWTTKWDNFLIRCIYLPFLLLH